MTKLDKSWQRIRRVMGHLSILKDIKNFILMNVTKKRNRSYLGGGKPGIKTRVW
jgi:hypothetical protein